MLPFCKNADGSVCNDQQHGCTCTNLGNNEWAIYKLKFRVDYTNCILKVRSRDSPSSTMLLTAGSMIF